MYDFLTVQISQRGVITLPKSIRERYRLGPGDDLSVLDLDGVLLLTPRRLQIDAVADRLRSEIEKSGESLESMLASLREEREKYGDRD